MMNLFSQMMHFSTWTFLWMTFDVQPAPAWFAHEFTLTQLTEIPPLHINSTFRIEAYLLLRPMLHMVAASLICSALGISKETV